MKRNPTRYMEFLGAPTTLQAGDGIDEAIVEIPLPTSKTEQFAMLIHFVHLAMSFPPRLETEEDYRVRASLLYAPEPATSVESNPNVIQSAEILYRMTETLLSNMAQLFMPFPMDRYYDPPILVAQDHLYLHAWRSTLVETAVAFDVKIGYTLERVSTEAFIAALVR